MSTGTFYLKDSYRNIQMGGSVKIETIEILSIPKYITTVQWDDDPEDPSLFESYDAEEAFQRHERMCSVFRKYKLMWKCEESILNPASAKELVEV